VEISIPYGTIKSISRSRKSPLSFVLFLGIGSRHSLIAALHLCSPLVLNGVHAGWLLLSSIFDCHLTTSAIVPSKKHVPPAPPFTQMKKVRIPS